MKLNNFGFNSFINNKDPCNTDFHNYTPTLFQQNMFDKLNTEIDEYNNRADINESETDINQTICCNYYNPDEFNKCKFSSSKNFSLLHLNIHSIQLHIDELKTVITESKLKITQLLILTFLVTIHHISRSFQRL